jgi:hypothetical protein
MSRYIADLIDDVRLSTENTDFSDTIGIKDSEFLRYLNDAQYRIQNLIIQQHPQVFTAETTLSVVGQQEAYDLPRKSYMGNKVSQVEYNYNTTGNRYFYPLRPASLYERDPNASGDPVKYIRRGGQILLKPVPQSSTGQLRITYVEKLPKLDLKRGSVASVTLDTSARTITSLFLDVSTDSVDAALTGNVTRVSFCDEEGNVTMSNVKVTLINSSTGEVTVDPAFVYDEGETISVADRITVGKFSNTHVMLDDIVERYLIAYATFKILQRDSNITDLGTQQQVLLEMENEIVAAYADVSDDIVEIPDIISEDDSWGIF